MTRIAAALIISAIAVSGIAHAEDFLTAAITIRVKAGPNQAAGLNRPEGEAVITLVPDDSRQNLAKVTLKPNSPDSLYKDAGTTDGSCPGTFGSWKFKIAAPEPNTDVTCVFDGQLLGCTGGGGGTPPTFQAAIVHLDLDVDSDNTSEPITEQKKPADQALYHTLKQNPLANAQDKLEDPQGADDKTNPGLLLVVNHGFEQITYAVADPKEDWQRPDKTPLKADDPDLAKGRIQITGRRDGQLKVTYPEAKLRIYRTDRGSPEYLAPGTEIAAKQDTDIPILLEGIDPGGSDGSCRITVEFTPDGASASSNSKATDVVKVTVVDLTLQVDRNRDGTPSGTGTDVTDKDHPFTFWYNNDSDNEASDEQPGTPDYLQAKIANLRDLEDFQRMRLVVRGADALLKDGKVGAGLRWMPGATHNPVIACFRNDDVAGSPRYLKEEATAESTLAQAERIGEVKDQAATAVAKTYLKDDNGAQVASMLWDCNGEGDRPANPEGTTTAPCAEGQLAVALLIGTRVVAINRHLSLRLGDMRNFYEHWTAGDGYTEGNGVLPVLSAVFPEPKVEKAKDSPINLATDQPVGLWDPKRIELVGTKSAVVFVHGYRMRTWERRSYAETMYKRMYWQQFNGKFVLLSWPTEFWTSSTVGGLFSPQNYDRSEFTARRCGYAMFDKIENMKSDLNAGSLILTAHSMGNVVLSEALRRAQAPIADVYLAFQSAEAAGAYKVDAPKKVLEGFWYQFANPGPYAPDLYAFDQPRQQEQRKAGRARISWEQWDYKDVIFRKRNGDPVYGAPYRNKLEQLLPVVDGQPLHQQLTVAIPQRIAYVNGQDPATAGAWVANQVIKVDRGFGYTAILKNALPEPNPRYVDEYRSNTYLDDVPWSGLQKKTKPQGGKGILLRWSSLAVDQNLQIEHAAILAFISAPHSTAVGATNLQSLQGPSKNDPWGKPVPAGLREAPFTGGVDANAMSGFNDNSDHDHSGEFEYHINKSKGPYQFWADVLSRIPAAKTAAAGTNP